MQRRMHLSEIVERIDLRDWDVRGHREVRPAWFPNEIERFTLRRVQSLACKGRKRGVHCTNGNDETCCVVQPWLRDRARRMGASVSSVSSCAENGVNDQRGREIRDEKNGSVANLGTTEILLSSEAWYRLSSKDWNLPRLRNSSSRQETRCKCDLACFFDFLDCEIEAISNEVWDRRETCTTIGEIAKYWHIPGDIRSSTFRTTSLYVVHFSFSSRVNYSL